MLSTIILLLFLIPFALCSFPSLFGPSDTLGAINHITPQSVLSAARLIRTGKTYSLGITLDASTPAFPPRTFGLTVVQLSQAGSNNITGQDDLVTTWLGIGTQMDGLGHVGIGDNYFNGRKRSEFVSIPGLTEFGIESIPPMVTRAVVLDMAAYFNQDRLEAGFAFNKIAIMGAAKRQGVELRKGDVVLFHTGWLGLLQEGDEALRKFIEGAPGLGKAGGRYLAEEVGVVAIGADTPTLEANPAETQGELFPVHQILLTRNGVYILENVETAELVRDGVSECMFVLGQAKMKGAVQMIINPVAIA